MVGRPVDGSQKFHGEYESSGDFAVMMCATAVVVAAGWNVALWNRVVMGLELELEKRRNETTLRILRHGHCCVYTAL